MIEKLKKLVRDDSPLAHLFIAVLIILLFYHYRWGLQLFNPTIISWVIDDSELANGFFSFGYFRNEAWHFPIGRIDSYFYPLGTNLYTSDIPLLGLLFKSFASILPEPFQYIGLWYLVCHVLQAWFAILLCQRFGIGGVARIIAVIFLLFTPLLMSRYIHSSLFCQWIILAGLWIYFLDPEKTPVKKILTFQLILFLLAGLIFAYMWAMAFGFSVALFWRLWLVDKRLTWMTALGTFCLHMAIMLLVWFTIGLFTFEGLPNYQMEGWGAFSLNLNSLYNPMGRAVIMPTSPYTQSQYTEGFAYLGAGMLMLAAGSMIAGFAWLMRKHPSPSSMFVLKETNIYPLIVFLIFSFVFSLSNRVSFDGDVIFEYPLPSIFSGLLNSFRSSGRFFWPDYYFIFILIFISLQTLIKNSVARGIVLGSCLLIQLYDIRPFLEKSPINYASYKPPINPVWEDVIKNFDKVLFYPGFKRSYLTFDDYRYFTYYTTVHQKKINVGYPARFDQDEAHRQIGLLGQQIADQGLNEQTLYISFESDLNSLILPIAKNEAHCFLLDGYLAVFKKSPHTEALANQLEKIAGPDRQSYLAAQVHARPWHPQPHFSETQLKASFYMVQNSAEHFYLKGWAFDETRIDNRDSIFLVLESSQHNRWIAPVHRFQTPDVTSFFDDPKLDFVGFNATVVTTNLPAGSYKTALLFKDHHAEYFFGWLPHTVNVTRASAPVEITSLPESYDQLRYDVNNLDASSESIQIDSWAFSQEKNSRRFKPYYVLTSTGHSYMLDASHVARPDVVDFFKDTSLLYAGQTATVKKSLLIDGRYTLGILLRDTATSIAYFSLTNKTVYVGEGDLESVSSWSDTPAGTDSVRAFVDYLDDKSEFVVIRGWSFIQSLDTDFSSASLILKSPDHQYQVQIKRVERTDLKDYFHLNFDASSGGFTTKFRKDALAPGIYKVCVLMDNLKTTQKTISCVDLTITVK